jgi:catechol 2,3-dioxygenase-like lactoylglutathione lyase family enzyme
MRIDHVNVRCSQLDQTADFLCSVVGLRPGWRPAFAFAGRWLYDDSGRAVVHLVEARQAPGEAGAVDHVAFYYDDLGAQLRHLATQGHRLEPRAVPGTDIQQCFLVGPDGLQIEFQGRMPVVAEAAEARA